MPVQQPEPVTDTANPSSTPGWLELVERLRNGDPSATERLIAAYSRGTRILLERRLSREDAGAAAGRILDQAISALRQGRICSLPEWVSFIRSSVKAATADGHPVQDARTRERAQVILENLRRCSPEERRMLVRYYTGGETLDQVLEGGPATPAGFRQLKARVAG
jgi:hypothetical protein